jgi:hypothetical protein
MLVHMIMPAQSLSINSGKFTSVTKSTDLSHKLYKNNCAHFSISLFIAL